MVTLAPAGTVMVLALNAISLAVKLIVTLFVTLFGLSVVVVSAANAGKIRRDSKITSNDRACEEQSSHFISFSTPFCSDSVLYFLKKMEGCVLSILPRP